MKPERLYRTEIFRRANGKPTPFERILGGSHFFFVHALEMDPICREGVMGILCGIMPPPIEVYSTEDKTINPFRHFFKQETWHRINHYLKMGNTCHKAGDILKIITMLKPTPANILFEDDYQVVITRATMIAGLNIEYNDDVVFRKKGSLCSSSDRKSLTTTELATL